MSGGHGHILLDDHVVTDHVVHGHTPHVEVAVVRTLVDGSASGPAMTNGVVARPVDGPTGPGAKRSRRRYSAERALPRDRLRPVVLFLIRRAFPMIPFTFAIHASSSLPANQQ